MHKVFLFCMSLLDIIDNPKHKCTMVAPNTPVPGPVLPGDSYIMYNIARAGDGAVPRPHRCQFPIFVGDAVLVPVQFKMSLCHRCWLHDFSIAGAVAGSGLKFCRTRLRVS